MYAVFGFDQGESTEIMHTVLGFEQEESTEIMHTVLVFEQKCIGVSKVTKKLKLTYN
jgi:hypothetical protein